MDLEIHDVAELFDVSESTIYRWISDGKIPAYRMNQLQHTDYRFSIREIEDWLLSHKPHSINESENHSEKRKPKRPGSKQFNLFRAVHKGAVLHNIPGQNKTSVIQNTMKHAAKDFHLDPEVATELFLDREKLMSTALGNGIAVPHARDNFLTTGQDAIIVVFPEEPLEYGALDGKAVHTLFFLLTSDARRHLQLLAKIAHLSSKPEALKFFMTKPKKTDILDYVKEWESQVANG